MKFLTILVILINLIPNILFAEDKADNTYKEARKCYHEMNSMPKGSQTRPKWYKCYMLFNNVAENYSKSPKAAYSFLSAGLIFRKIYELTGNEDDAIEAISSFRKVADRYSKSSLADDALFNIGNLEWEVLRNKDASQNTMLKILRWYPDGDMQNHAKTYLTTNLGVKLPKSYITRRAKPKDRALIKSLKRVTSKDQEKLVLKTKGDFSIQEITLDLKNPKLTGYKVIFKNGKFSKTFNTNEYSYIGKSIIRDIKAVQEKKKEPELVLILKNGYGCNAKKLKKELNITCAKELMVQSNALKPVSNNPWKKNTSPTISKAKQIAVPTKSKLTIIIDPGHGGTDTGAIGKQGTMEKDIVLKIAKRLGWQLRNKYSADVHYTRIDDSTLTLDERIKFANTHNADLFISIHANAAQNANLDGYQTYYLNNASDKAARRLAARENASLGKNMDDIEKIVLTLMQNANTDESSRLAKNIHKRVLSKMSKYGLKDRKIKSALFYVLVGAKCPSVLIETSFISNPKEEKNLKNANYQENLALGIFEGIKNYLNTSQTLRAKR